MTATPTRLTVHLPEAELQELRWRLDHIRWPLDPAGRDWSYGVGQDDLEELCAQWRAFDWPAMQERINRIRHQRVVLGGLGVHAATVTPAAPSAGTVVLLHGWPSSFLEMLSLARELATPTELAQPAYTVIIPSLPGFGLSDPAPADGLNGDQQAALLLDLLTVLGHRSFAVHAYDIAASMAVRAAL